MFIKQKITAMPLLTLTMELLKNGQTLLDVPTDALSEYEVNFLAHKASEVIDQPFLDVERDLMIFAKIVKGIDRELFQLLPYDYYMLVKDETEGVSREVAEEIERRVIPIIINEINIPILTDRQKEKIIGIILGLIVKAMIKGFKIETGQVA